MTDGAQFLVRTAQGAPLDVLKVIAAALMTVDHVNAIFFSNMPNMLWQGGRCAFPLFCLGVAINLVRGASVPQYLGNLLVFGALAQPIYTAALGATNGNILFTLAAGVAISAALQPLSPLVQHSVFAVGTLAILAPFVPARAGLDFGLAGILFPAALYLTLIGRRAHSVWTIALLIGLNWYNPDPLRFAPFTVAALALTGSLLAVMVASAFQGLPRFLHRYALQLFYPGHLLILALLKAIA